MVKTLKYVALVIFSFLWFLGCSKATVVYLADNGLLADDFRYGDLYRLSNLPEFKEKSEKCNQTYSDQKKDISLYLAGDSFTEEGRIAKKAYASKNYQRSHVAEVHFDLNLVEGKKILVIETVERHFRERFSEKPWDNWQLPKAKEDIEEDINISTFLWAKLRWFADLKVPYYEEMHEAVLFSSDFILRIKEIKADWNWKVFGKTDPKVKVVKQELVYDLDIDPGISSVYDTVSEEEINRIVENVNQTRKNYLAMGFDEVYLSVIPNKTSLLVSNDTPYNHLLERVEHHPKLEVPVISVWQEFSNGNYFQKGDSHWNCGGIKIWVDKLNAILTQD